MMLIRRSHSVRMCQNERLINTMVLLDIRLPLFGAVRSASCGVFGTRRLSTGTLLHIRRWRHEAFDRCNLGTLTYRVRSVRKPFEST